MMMIAGILLAISVIICIVGLASHFGIAVHPLVQRFPKYASFISGAILGTLVGLIPGAGIGWMAGSKAVGAAICFLFAAGCGYAWMRFETRSAESETEAQRKTTRRVSAASPKK